MSVVEEYPNKEQWDSTNPAAKQNLLRVVRNEAEGFFKLLDDPASWEGSTAAGHWQARDIVGHLIDTTEGYLERFEAARSGTDVAALAGLPDMAGTADSRAQKFRSDSREELLGRLRRDFDTMMDVFEGLSDDDWTNLTVTHGYMGPLPAFFYPAFQLMDYGVHSWDVREGQGEPHFFSSDAADLLVPFMFILWQATTDASRLNGQSLAVGVRVSGRNAGTWRVDCTDEGLAYEPGDTSDLRTVIEFDPASFVLTAFGRYNAGTAHGDLEAARRFGGLFFRI
jgi:uncharacterized protein (TIGR03083 family)